MLKDWYFKTPAEIFEVLQSSEHGLNQEEVNQRLQKYGFNKLPESKVDSLAIIFLKQFQSPLIYILLAAGAVVLVMGEIIDGMIIMAVLVFNAVVGTIQESKAQNTLQALKKFVETKATVLREGKNFIVSDKEVVPGDIIIFQTGDKIPADARILSANNLKIDEAILTGESESVHKTAEVLKKIHKRTDLSILEQRNMLFKGSYVTAGNGMAIVTATGLDTVIGKISKVIATIDTEIPLKANIRYLSRFIVITVVGIGAILFFLGLTSGKTIKEMFTTVVSLSVSIIPEGLPIVMTLVLASGVWRMSKHNALVKKLQAVEALGQTRVIAVDKTGTLTKNEMTIQKVYVDGKIFEIGGIGYEPKGEVKLEGKIIDPLNHPEMVFIGRMAALGTDARLLFSEENKEWTIIGDPTEAAMVVFAEKIGFHKEDLERESPKIAEIPFDYKIKYRAVKRQIGNEELLMIIGAPEVVLNLCQKEWHEGRSRDLSKEEADRLKSIFVKMAEEGLRVVAVAVNHEAPKFLKPEKIHSLTFIGFFGMKDGLRVEVPAAMAQAIAAGIKVVMITGDHKITAQAIAKEAGIYKEGDEILTGSDIDNFSDDELLTRLAKTSVFARVTPEHKLRIIKAYKKRGELVAMTGDGVNDAPSLVAADLGVAMGKIGTEVAKEAADIVLLDDNFGNIVSAIEEGRSIYKTIRKVVLYLFSTSLGEVLVIGGAILAGWPLPILPAQIIWLNFVTDGFLDVALAMEPKEKGLLTGVFERPKKYLINSLMIQRMILMALPMMIGALILFRNIFETDLVKAQTVCLTVLAVFQWFNAWNCRSEDKSIFRMNFFSNRFLVGSTIVIIFLQFLAIYHPVMQKLLRTKPLAFSDWLIIGSVAVSIIVVEEIRKLFYHRKEMK